MEKINNYDQYNACLKIIISQTNYSEEEAVVKLKKWDNNFINVIKEYLNPNFQKKKEPKKKSLNQNIIGEIRKFKDKQCLSYIKEKNHEYELNKLAYLRNNAIQETQGEPIQKEQGEPIQKEQGEPIQKEQGEPIQKEPKQKEIINI